MRHPHTLVVLGLVLGTHPVTGNTSTQLKKARDVMSRTIAAFYYPSHPEQEPDLPRLERAFQRSLAVQRHVCPASPKPSLQPPQQLQSMYAGRPLAPAPPLSPLVPVQPVQPVSPAKIKFPWQNKPQAWVPFVGFLVLTLISVIWLATSDGGSRPQEFWATLLICFAVMMIIQFLTLIFQFEGDTALKYEGGAGLRWMVLPSNLNWAGIEFWACIFLGLLFIVISPCDGPMEHAGELFIGMGMISMAITISSGSGASLYERVQTLYMEKGEPAYDGWDCDEAKTFVMLSIALLVLGLILAIIGVYMEPDKAAAAEAASSWTSGFNFPALNQTEVNQTKPMQHMIESNPIKSAAHIVETGTKEAWANDTAVQSQGAHTRLGSLASFNTSSTISQV